MKRDIASYTIERFLMRVGEIEVTPIGGESLGVRSLCTSIQTPDVLILLDPSAALAKRYGLEPHPSEYHQLMRTLKQIRSVAREADVLSISHYHFDHIRPGFKNCLYNLSSRGERREMFTDKTVLAKDNRESINASQRRRGYYFEKDVKDVVKELTWADRRTVSLGDTTVTYSHALPHGSEGTFLGYVLSTLISYGPTRVLVAPDVQGPVARDSFTYFNGLGADLAIVGGPPTYLSKFENEERELAFGHLQRLGESVPFLIVDHHNMRDADWEETLQPVRVAAENKGNRVLTMAEALGVDVQPLEAQRRELYGREPPSEEFMAWCDAPLEWKTENMPPL